MASDFDKQFKGILNSVRSTINPDYAIPKGQEQEPMNVRIKRMRDSAEEISAQIKALSAALSAFNTNLNALTEEIQPYLQKENCAPADAESTKADAAPEAAEEKKPEQQDEADKTDKPSGAEEKKPDEAPKK
jgi:GTPase SAR1 family protein